MFDVMMTELMGYALNHTRHSGYEQQPLGMGSPAVAHRPGDLSRGPASRGIRAIESRSVRPHLCRATMTPCPIPHSDAASPSTAGAA